MMKKIASETKFIVKLYKEDYIFRRLVLTAIFAIVFFISTYYLTYLHEATHSRIYDRYGVNNTIEINFDYMFDGTDYLGRTHSVRTNEICDYGTNCDLSHSLIEIVDYLIDAIYLIVLLVIYIFLWTGKFDKKFYI